MTWRSRGRRGVVSSELVTCQFNGISEVQEIRGYKSRTDKSGPQPEWTFRMEQKDHTLQQCIYWYETHGSLDI